MSVHTSALHQIYEQQDIARFRAFLSPSAYNAGSASKKGKESAAATGAAAGGGVGSYGASGSLSRSPRFGGGYFNDMNIQNGPSKDEVNARDRLGRSVLHLVASEVAAFPEDSPPDTITSLDYLEALLKSPVINVNLQDKENGWTALHRAVYAGNMVLVRRLLQYPDTSTIIRDWEGLTAFDLLNSTLLGTNPMDLLDNIPEEEQEHCRRELVTWGANRNFVLGLQGDSERSFPERVPLEPAVSTYKKPGQEDTPIAKSYDSVAVEKIAMSKLHSGLLTDEPRGNFRLCGFGSTTGRLGHSHNHPQFAFEPLKGFENQKVVDFALGQDHTIVCTQEGNIYTFGLNAFSVLGYPVENVGPTKPGTVDDDLVQVTPKRLFGIFKKEFVKGVAASRYHSVAYTEDALFTWGKNNGQLGYSSSATPIQPTPRKVAAVDKPIKQVCATEVATVCLLESGEVLVLHRDTHFRIAFPMTRLPAAMQPYRPPKLSWRPMVTKINGSGSNFIAITSMGDLFSWQLDNPALEAPSTAPSNYGRDIKPYRVWEERKVFTACTDAAIAGDTIIIATRSGHVYVSARRKELTSIKGVDLRGNATGTSSSNRRNHKFSKVMNLQRVTKVAVSSSGGFGAIRRDAPLMQISPAGDSLSDSLLHLLPHYRRLDASIAKDKALPAVSPDALASELNETGEDDEDDTVEADILNCTRICQIITAWNPGWSLPLAGSDMLLVAEGESFKIPVHSTLLSARSPALKRILVDGGKVTGLRYTATGTPTLSLPKSQQATLLLLLHYLYSDNLPAMFDGRVFRRIYSQVPSLKLDAARVKAELSQLADVLELSSLSDALQAFGRTLPAPTLTSTTRQLLSSSIKHDIVLQTASRDITCHSTILRATCPFFEAIFDDPDWYIERMEEREDELAQPLLVDLQHFDSEIVEIAIEDLYTENASTRMQSRRYEKPEDRLNFAISVISVANELMLDRLRAVCSSIIRPFINLNTVCALLCEAIFYEASSLQEICMQYMACNIETMLEQRLLDLLPVYALDKFATYCRRRQLDRLPRTARSAKQNAELREKYADFVKEMDIPKPTGGYRRYTRNPNYSIRSPKLSPAQFSASLRLSPNMAVSPTLAMSPTPTTMVPPSPALSAISVTSPSVRPSNGDDGETFEMEDLHLDAPVSSSTLMSDPLRTMPSTSRVQAPQGLPWRRPTGLAAPAASFQDIMAQEIRAPPKTVYTPPRRISENYPPMRNGEDTPVSPPHKLTQKERKRQQASSQADVVGSVSNNAEKASSPWRPILPGAWKPPEAGPEQPSLSSIQSQQKQTPGSAPIPRTASGRGTPDTSSPLNRRLPSLQGNKGAEGSSSQGRDVNAANAPVITPVRLQPKRDASNSNRPPETRSHDTPWVNYLSTVSVKPTQESPSAASQSFATIQNLQVNEKDALQRARGPMSLKEIQAEEDAVRQEAEFLSWFEEESKRAQQAAGIATVKPEKGAGRGRGGRGGGAQRGGNAQRGGRGGSATGSTKGRGQPKAKQSKEGTD